MSIGGIMRTSVSGMTAQASKLGVVAENIANSDTTGYKQSQTEFSSLILPGNASGYNSGAVEVQTRTFVSEQGGLSYTGNDNSPKKLDLAVNGNGFLAVSDGSGGNFLTRAGSFTQQADGSLVNAAGYTLMGYPVGTTGTDAVLNGFAGLEEVNLKTSLLSANPTTKGILTVPLNKAFVPATTGSPPVALATPSTNPDAKPLDGSTVSTSITVYNNSGEAVKLDIYYTKLPDTAGTPPIENQWEMAVYDSRNASAGANAPFPYTVKGTTTPAAPLASAKLTFDPTTFKLSSIVPSTTPTPASTLANTSSTNPGILTINMGNTPNGIGGGIFNLNIGDTTQFTGNTQPLAASVDGNPAEVIKDISVGEDGTVTAAFASGTTRDLFRIPLASVNSPDSMIAKAGNVYSAGIESGTVLMGFGGSGGFGKLTAGALEDSTVDLAGELTNMIESQRNYTANSKVFQTGSEILDVLVNLKR